MKKLFIAFLFLFLFANKAYAALYINEFSSNGDSDWVEIYNSDSSSVDLSSYILRDSTDSNKLELSGTINGNGFKSFDWGNKLNNDGDTIKLLIKSDESTVDTVIYGNSGALIAPAAGQTGGRSSDGLGKWVVFNSPTRDASNNSSSVYETPVPTATQTPTPTPNPTNTPTPAPTSTPIPSSTPVPTKKITPTEALKITQDPKLTPQVLAAQANAQEPQASAQDDNGVNLGGKLGDLEPQKEQGYDWWKLFIVMGAVIITGAVGVFLYNNHIKERSEELNQEI